MQTSRNFVSWALFFLWPVLLSIQNLSCARVQKVVAVEGDEATRYESLGMLEVKTKADVMSPQRLGWTTVKFGTLGFARTPSRGEIYKKKLDALLADKARKHYGADRVIHVAYWPDLNSNSFPQGLIYARGEMIHYQTFPESTDQNPHAG